jgi:hypothetical protein
MNLQYLKWDAPPEKKEKTEGEEDDDIVFDNSDPMFKLMPHILLY